MYSKATVYAQTTGTTSSPVPSPTLRPASQKPTFKEALSLQFTVAADYTLNLSGVIELTNNTGKDVSLTEYSMDLPYFTLKDTTIGSISPNAFLVDMYSKNGSILFTFKSLYTKPVVIGKTGKIVFTFSAKVDRPYNDFGGLRSLSFPFILISEQRTVTVTVIVNEALSVLSAPQSPQALVNRHVYSVSDANGKNFLFRINDNPILFSISGTKDVPLPLFDTSGCINQQIQSCAGCSSIMWQPRTGEETAQRKETATTLTATYARTITPICKSEQDRVAGYILLPEQKALYPAEWKQQDNKIIDLALSLSGTSITDPGGYLAIPVQHCASDAECLATVEKLKTYTASITYDVAANLHQTTALSQQNDISIGTYNKGTTSFLTVKNLTDHFIALQSLTITPTTDFTIPSNIGYILPPQETLTLELTSVHRVQTNNQDIVITLHVNDHSYPITIQQTTIFLLTIIELLGFVFAISLSIALISGIILLFPRYKQNLFRFHIKIPWKKSSGTL